LHTTQGHGLECQARPLKVATVVLVGQAAVRSQGLTWTPVNSLDRRVRLVFALP